MRAQIGSYRIERVLGDGGMGIVYKGCHDRLGRAAAIKTLLPKHAGDPDFRRRLLSEAHAQSLLQHPNVVALYDLFDDGGEIFIAMEYVDGETLTSLLNRRSGSHLPIDEAMPLFEQLLDALEYVHGRKIIHRDVKPSNVMVCGGQVKLADFGIALLAGEPRLTTTPKVIGTAEYMSPEQLEGKPLDCRSDVYSVAAVFHCVLAGRPPFEKKAYLAQIHDRIAGPPDLRTIAPEVPAGVCEAIAIAMKYSPDDRFRTAAAFRDALGAAAAGFVSAAVAPDADVSVVVAADQVPTEPFPVVAEAESPQGSGRTVAWVIAGSIAAGAVALMTQPDRTITEVNVPLTASAAGPLIPRPVPVDPPPFAKKERTLPAPDPQPDSEPDSEPKPEPKPVPKPVPPKSTPVLVAERPKPDTAAEDERRRREINELRGQIARGLAKVERDLESSLFDDALEELGRIGEIASRHRDDFWQELDAIDRLRGRIMQGRIDASMWASRLADVQEDLRQRRWPEAERFAQNIIDDPRAPAAVAERAAELLQQAKQGRISEFGDTRFGKTNNSTVRKPSSPPRNQR